MDKKTSSKKIDVFTVFQDGFSLYKKNIVFGLILGLIAAILSYQFSLWQTGIRGGGYSLLFILRSVFTISISAILILYLHDVEKNRKAKILTAMTNFFSDYFLITMITAVALAAIIIGGFIFFVIPGILFAVWFSQTYYFLLLEKKSPTDAMRASKKLTEGKRLLIILVFIVQGFVSGVVGAVAGRILPEAAQSLTAIFPGSYFWFVDYVLYKKLVAGK